MNGADSECDPLDVLVDDFVRRYRRGESPTIGEYAARHPELGDSIRRTFAAALVLEKVKSDALSPRSDALSVAPDAAPTRLGEYRIIREIARGGMGVVYEAEQETLGRRVALKVLYRASLSPAALQRFLREARATARLHHTNIVPLFAVGEQEGIHYYAMQFIDGQGLDAVIRDWTGKSDDSRSAARHWETVASIGLQIAEALAHAHENCILHRDVKPSNVMLDAHGKAWLTDFGLAKLQEQPDLTRGTDTIGTLRYMAPEQLAGRCNACSDQFSAGLILYELLTLRPAYEAENRQELVHQIANAKPAAPRQINRQIPLDLETITLKAIAREERDRYESAAALAEDLRRFLDGQPIRARRTSAIERLRRWSRRNPALAAVSGSLLTLLLALAIASSVAAERFHRLALREWRAGQDANAARRSAEAALARVYPDDGLAAARRSDNAEAALWFAHAALLSPPGEEARRLNSTRASLFARSALVPTAALDGRGSKIDAVRFDPTGRYLLTGGTVLRSRLPQTFQRVWELASERALPLPVGPELITEAVWDADGKALALGTSVGDVSIWTFPGLRPRGGLRVEAAVSVLQFSRDGKYLAIAEGPRVHVWDCNRLALCGPLLDQAADVALLRFSGSSDHLLIITGSGRARVFPFPTTSTEPSFSVDVPRGSAGEFVEDGRQVVIAEAGSLVWRDSDSGHVIRRTALPAEPDWLACDAAARCIVVGAGDQIRAFDAHTGRQTSSVPDYRRGIRCAAIDPTASVLLSSSADRQPALWDLASGTRRPVALAALGVIRSAAFAPDGRSFAVAANDGLVRVWILPASPLAGFRISLGGQTVSLRIDPGGRYALATCLTSGSGLSGIARVIDLQTGRPASADIQSGGMITAAEFSPDRRHIAIASADSAPVLQFWEWRTARRVAALIPLPAPADGLGYDSTGASVVVLCGNGERLLVRVADGSVTRTWKSAPSAGMSKLVRGGGIRFSPDDRSVLTWGSTDVEVRDAATGALRYPPLRHDDVCGDVRLSPDGAYLATAGWDKTVRMWEFATGKPIGAPLVHGDAVHLVQFVADGRQLLTGCTDGVFRLWDWRSGQLVYPPTRDEEVAMSAAATPDGRWLLISSGERTLRVWDRSSGNLVSPPLPVSGACWGIEVSSNGRYVVATGTGADADVFHLEGLNASPPPDPGDLLHWCEIVSGERLEGGQLVRLNDDQWLNLWRHHQASHRP